MLLAKKITLIITLIFVLIASFCSCSKKVEVDLTDIYDETLSVSTKELDISTTIEKTTVQETTMIRPVDISTTKSTTNYKNMSDAELLALITMAESEGESDYGMRLVIDCVLNRVDSSSFPNTVYDVIFQPHQFTPTTNGRLRRCYVDPDILNLVNQELNNRTNYDVLYFREGGYFSWGTPIVHEGCHYFSGE